MEIIVGNIETVVMCSLSDKKMMSKINRTLSCEAPGARYTWRFKHTDWDGRVYFFGEISDHDDAFVFNTGFLAAFLSLLPTNTKFALTDVRDVSVPKKLDVCNVPLRKYQWEAAVTFFENKLNNMWWPRGIIRAATGAGKTETAVGMIEMANRPACFIVHRKDLMYQAAERLKKYGFNCGLVGDGSFDPCPGGVTVAMVQTLASRLEKKPPKGEGVWERPRSEEFALLGLLASTEFLIVDEAHTVAATLDKGNQLSMVLNQFNNAYMRLGLTGTPFLRDEYSNFLLESAVGSVVHSVSARDLIDEGWLQEAKITMHEIAAIPSAMQKVPHGSKKSRYQHQYTNAIELHSERNDLILSEMKRLPGPTLCLVRTTTHGDALATRAQYLGMDVPFISGRHKVKTRKEAVEKLVKTKGMLISSGIFDEGIDIPELQSLILAAGGKSKGRSLQRIGRGLRKSKDKTDLNVIDFYDKTSILASHAEARKRTWMEEGYEVMVVK